MHIHTDIRIYLYVCTHVYKYIGTREYTDISFFRLSNRTVHQYIKGGVGVLKGFIHKRSEFNDDHIASLNIMSSIL